MAVVPGADDRFIGSICGFGTTSGTRLVVGRWLSSPLGSFADVMVERPDGMRMLLAPSSAVASYIGGIYAFDEVVTVPVGVTSSGSSLSVTAGPLEAGGARVAHGGGVGAGVVARRGSRVAGPRGAAGPLRVRVEPVTTVAGAGGHDGAASSPGRSVKMPGCPAWISIHSAPSSPARHE